MKSASLLLAALLLAAPAARGDEPLKSVDAFEADVRRCLLEGKDPSACLEQTLRGHFPPGSEKLNDVVKQVVGLFRQWLGDDRVFAVHGVKSRKIGNFYDERVFMIEDARGNLIMFETGCVNKFGKWWLHRFNVSSKKETMQAVLGIDL